MNTLSHSYLEKRLCKKVNSKWKWTKLKLLLKKMSQETK